MHRRVSVSIDKDPLVIGARLAPEQCLQECGGLWPERTETFLASLAKESHARSRLEADVLPSNIQSFLDARAIEPLFEESGTYGLLKCAPGPLRELEHTPSLSTL
jgi:hypothetical protein